MAPVTLYVDMFNVADDGEPDWSVENRVEPDVGAFHGAAEFTNSLMQPVLKCLPKKMRAAADHAAARAEALPRYLQPGARSRREQTP